MDGDISLRGFRDEDLGFLDLLGTDPAALGEFEWFGFGDARTRRRRWEQDGLIGPESANLAVVNIAEQRALERIGFRREGVLRQVAFRDGAWRDTVLYGLLREEYRP